jgi:Flp pilus assembly pilin Flp
MKKSRLLIFLRRSLALDARGATSIEYSVIAAGVAGVLITVITTMGDQIKTTFYDKLAALFQ